MLQERYRARYAAETTYLPNGTVIRERKVSSQILEWGLEPDNYILFLGRFSPEKNCHLLIEAYERLDTSAKLVLAGGSSHTNVYVDHLRKHQSNKILFLDWISGDSLDELLTNAALFVLPSDLEGLSLALLDAMGAGVCVLTSDIAENLEVMEGAGFTFRCGDARALEHMLRLLLSDAEGRAAAGRAAQQRVRDRYLWPRIAAEVGQVYEEVVRPTGATKAYPPEKVAARVKSEPPNRAA